MVTILYYLYTLFFYKKLRSEVRAQSFLANLKFEGSKIQIA